MWLNLFKRLRRQIFCESAVLRRRLPDGTEIQFTVASVAQDEASLASLTADIEKAATEGALVANIQKKAVENHVLTPSLKTMSIEITKPTVTEKQVTVTVVDQVRSADTDTSTSTSEEQGNTSDGNSSAEAGGFSTEAAVAISCCLMVLLLLGAIVFTQLHSKKKKKAALSEQQRAVEATRASKEKEGGKHTMHTNPQMQQVQGKTNARIVV